MNSDPLALRSVNGIRLLSIDGVQAADSGHPGMPMGAAPMAYVVWKRHLRHNPANPNWFGRDRFVLSPGHGSMLLYSLLHLTGYDLPLDELKAFRQWGSLTPGHPEVGHTPGVETTTGPLGQGMATGVGMAIAEAHLAARINTEDLKPVDFYVYGVVSDGDLMEGISHEAASLAGHLGLGKLIYLYDSNKISIDGSTDLSFTDDTAARFRAYGWQVIEVEDGNDLDAIDAAVTLAKGDLERPSLVICKTIIGFGSPNKAGTEGVHGSPLGRDEINLVRRTYEWEHEDPFFIPDDIRDHLDAREQGRKLEERWNQLVLQLADALPDAAERLRQVQDRALPAGWRDALPAFEADDKGMATRASSGKVLNALAPAVPALIGGSADLTPSNKTDVKGRVDFQQHTPEGGYFHFGVREHGMAAAANGMALTGLRPYVGTFLIFSDYMRPAIRLSALMHQPVVYVMTHDSIGLGEDGPTHQPVEQLMSLRMIPNTLVLRPADANETAYAWRAALENTTGPTLLALTRQNLPTLDRTRFGTAEGTLRGAYVLKEAEADLRVLLLATGSEIEIALAAAETLESEGVGARVVSMPSWELFERQDASYREQVLPPSVAARVSVEAGVTTGWSRYVGAGGVSVGLDRFGASAPYEKLYEEFGITPQAVAEAARRQL
jgi:transketolase